MATLVSTRQAPDESQQSQISPLSLRPSAWAAAVELYNAQLTKDSRKQLPTYAISATDPKRHPTATLEELIEATKAARAKCEDSKSSLRKKFDYFLERVDQYAVAVDVLIQQNPDTSAIAWGAIRMLITAALNEKQITDKLSAVLVDVMNDIGRYEEYLAIYPFVDRLDGAIARLYAENINFLVRSRIFYEMNPISRAGKSVISPFETKFKGILEKMDKLRAVVEREVALVTAKEQNNDSHAGAKFRDATIIHSNLQKARWIIEDQHRKELATKREEKLLRNLRIWLVVIDFQQLRREKQCLEGTCQWILEKEQYKEWLTRQNGSLWVYGIPGCGKSVMACFLLNELGKSWPVVHFFCRNDEERKRNPKFIVATLILQLMDHPELAQFQNQISTMIAKVFNSFPDISNITIDRLCALLGRIIALLPPVILLVDALDECEPEGTSRDFLQNQLTSFAEANPNVKLVVLSRHEEPFIAAFEKRCYAIAMGRTDVAHDIQAVITKSVSANTKLRKLGDRIINVLLDGADGMFLWAELMLHTLKCARNMKAVERMLKDLPVGLDGVYQQILTTIGRTLSAEELLLQKELFGWITAASRPMTLDELCTALAIESGDIYLDDGNLSLDLMADIRKVCGPLVQISNDTVQIVHISVKEMLWKKGGGPKITSPYSESSYLIHLQSEVEHSRVAMTCLTYLSFEEFQKKEHIGALVEGSGHSLTIASQNRLLQYATLNWVYHVTKSEGHGASLIALLSSFLESPNCFTWLELYTAFIGVEPHCFAHHYQLRSQLQLWLSSVDFSGKIDTKEILAQYLGRAVSAGLGTSEHLYGKQDLRTIKVAQRLGCLFDHEDRLDDATTIQEGIIRDASHITDSQTQYVVRKSCIELSSYHCIRENYPKGIELLEDVLGGKDSSEWIYDILGAEAMADLAAIYRLQGRLTCAQELMEKGVEGLTHFRGAQHILTIRYTLELCRIYHELKEGEKAQTMVNSTLKIADEILGRDHPRALHGRHLLANIMYEEGELDEAEKILEEVLSSFIKLWGPKTRSAAQVRMDLATIFVDQRRLLKATHQYAEAVVIFEEHFGRSHSSTIHAINKLNWSRKEVGVTEKEDEVTQNEDTIIEKEAAVINRFNMIWFMGQSRMLLMGYVLAGAIVAAIAHLLVLPTAFLLGLSSWFAHPTYRT